MAANAINTKRAQWITDYQTYRQKAVAEARVAGYSDPDVQSCAHIPLMFEKTVIGSLSIDSRELIQWDKEGYRRPLQELSDRVALVVRDVTLQEDREDLTAMIAFSATVSGDAIWRHWARQRLAEASAAIYQSHLALENNNTDKVHKTLLELTDIIDTISRGRPPDQEEPACSFGEIILSIRAKYKDSKLSLIVSTPEGLPIVKAPKFHVQNILQILLDNAVQAIESAGIGAEIQLVIHDKDSEFVTITVADDGPGIPDDIRIRLFRERVPSTIGHGIGLLVARGTVLQYGGDLSLQPTGKGACFALKLPRA